MDYEIVDLTKKIVTGLRIRTSNHDANMVKNIGMLWQNFFANGVYQSISNKKNDKSIGLYTNYEKDVDSAYDMMVCCETVGAVNGSNGIETQIIPEGKYAKFVVYGDVQQAVASFWTTLWSMDLDRKYSCDFEEYQSGCDMAHAEIHIYISLN